MRCLALFIGVALVASCGGGGGERQDASATPEAGVDKGSIGLDSKPASDKGSGDSSLVDGAGTDIALPSDLTVDFQSFDQGQSGTDMIASDVTGDSGNGQTGSGSCADIVWCLSKNACGPQDSPCINQCISQGSSEAQSQFANLFSCLQSKCAQFLDKLYQRAYCLYQNCKEQVTPCDHFGEKTCKKVLDCTQGCGQDRTCWLECLSQAKYEAKLAFFAYLACIEQNCVTTPGSLPSLGCVTEHCSAQFSACQ